MDITMILDELKTRRWRWQWFILLRKKSNMKTKNILNI